MSLLILGPRSPGREIDVYLQPLIEKLKDIWSLGIHTYDSLNGKIFSCMQLSCGRLMTFQHMMTYLGGV